MKVNASGHAHARREGAPCDDAWNLRERNLTFAAALADGVGASREGGIAARRAVDVLVDYTLSRPRAWSPRRALTEITARINSQLHAESLERHGQPELTTTLCAVLLESDRLFGCNVGDSAVFHWRAGRLVRLSQSHSLETPALSHVLTRALGLEAEVEPHAFETDLSPGDVILLCSDGVTNPLPEMRIAELLSRRASARTLVSAAREAASRNGDLPDDASAVVIEIGELGHAAETFAQHLEITPRLRPGQVFDESELVRALDAAERVWLASRRQGPAVVLKFPPIDAAASEALRDAFVREAWNASRLSSPDLVRVWIPEGATLRYYAMEYLEAPTLREALRSGPLPVDDVRALARFLLRAAQFLLQHDLAHGDLKPDNILAPAAGPAGTYRLLDLGSAADIFSVTSRAGTPSYLAPERFRGAPVTERTEIFAIGVTLYEALGCAYPYGEVERFQTPRFDSPARRPSLLNPSVPPWLESIVLRAIDPDPERRFQHYSEMDYALNHPGEVAPHHRKDAPLLERNPLLFYKVLSFVLGAVCLGLLALLARR